jgi:Ca-activated chloride channel family protein
MKKLIIIFVIALFAMISANAQGVIIPRPCRPEMARCPPLPPRPAPMPNALPVKSINIDTKINGQVATTHLEQVFRNDTPYTLEGTYFFPIPETASIVEFSIWENGKKLVGEVRTREEARRIYDEIVRKQRDPGLLEYAGKDLFQASIFPIPPNSDKKLEMTYSQVLKAENGTVAYRYPLGTGKNLWNRPMPMVENNTVRNNGNSTQKFGTVSGRVEIVATQALRNIYSPSHQIDSKRKSETSNIVTFETNSNDNDFQLFYGLSDKDFGMSLLTYREAGKDGYFLLQLSPKDDISDKDLVAKDVVFVLDTSGSMADEGKMDKARSALLFGIRTLREGDKFNVINFAGEEHLMENGLISADTNGKKRGEEFVKKLQPTGGTNINDAVIAAMKQFNASERPKMLVFMTDGLPTVGETNVERILANISKEKKQDIRIFPFGVGYDVNTTLLDKLGSENSGVSDYVQPKEDLEIKVSNFFARVSSPVLSDLAIDFAGVQTELIYPRKLTDIFKGMQLTLLGRYKNDRDLKNITLRLTGKAGKETRSFNYPNSEFPFRDEENSFLPRLWASRRVGWLVEQVRLNGETKELKDEIIQLGTKFGIVTPYTSYLATDGSESRGNTIANRQIQSLPSVESGRAAVDLSVRQNTQQSNVIVANKKSKNDKSGKNEESNEVKVFEENSTQNQFVANKNFFNQNNVWVDSEYKKEANLKEIKVKFMSDEYLKLAKDNKELAQYLALGEEVVIVWNNQVYRIIK